ncbi:MAG: DUF3617 family protein [Pseudomonadota bacterium]|nr:DUF3617 family protein [Pseudomonadota bacterium]
MLLFITLILVTGAAQAEDKFQRKSGLWEVKRTPTRAEGKIRVSLLCVDQTSDDGLRQLSGGGPNERCKADKVRREGDQLFVDAVCEIDHTSTKATTHAVVTGKADSAYKIESKSTYDPPLRGKAEGSAVLEARWVGACRPDQRPGDYILPNGMKARERDPEAEKAAAEQAAAKTAAEKAARAAKAAKPGRQGNFMPVPKPD